MGAHDCSSCVRSRAVEDIPTLKSPIRAFRFQWLVGGRDNPVSVLLVDQRFVKRRTQGYTLIRHLVTEFNAQRRGMVRFSRARASLSVHGRDYKVFSTLA